MNTLTYHTLDVFTQQAYAGNPLAVVLGADALNHGQMQRIAAEFNLSETVFVSAPQAGGSAKIRIFTPKLELPFAGHPVIGTACLLAEEKIHNAAISDQLVLETGVGLVSVQVKQKAGEACFAELRAAVAPEVRPIDVDVEQILKALGLSSAAMRSVKMASCGAPFVVLELKQPESLAAISLDYFALQKVLENSWGRVGVYAVAQGYEGQWRARMFAPNSGIAEDSATGSAALAFAGALALADERMDCTEAISIMQGVEMQRASTLHVRYSKTNAAITAICVGGHAVKISQGQLRIP